MTDRETTARLAAARKGDTCPECGENDNIEVNGEKGPGRTWRCQECHCQWDQFVGLEGQADG